MILVAIIVALCLLLEAFFSGAELALISADRIALSQRAARGGKRGHLVQRFLDKPADLIATTLVGSNVALVLSTVVTTLYFLESRSAHPEWLSVGILTPLVLVFGEIVPKSLFQAHADALAPRAIYLLWGFHGLLAPVVSVSSRLADVLARAFRLQERRPFVTRDELRLLLQLPEATASENPMSEAEKRMITRIFSFSETTVADAMIPLSEVFALAGDTPLSDAAREAQDKGYTRIPVYGERVDQVEGVVHTFDLLRAAETRAVRAAMRPAVFVPEGQPVLATLRQLQREAMGMAIVVNEYGGAVGIVTLEDILEEVVGEIEDEYDQGPPAIRREGPNVWRVKAHTPLSQVNAELRVALPEGEEYETIAGLVLDRLKRIPAAGEVVPVGAVMIAVTAATPRSIEEVRITVGR